MISFEKGISPSSENNLVNIQQNKPCPQICLSKVKKRQVVIDMPHRLDIWVIHSAWPLILLKLCHFDSLQWEILNLFPIELVIKAFASNFNVFASVQLWHWLLLGGVKKDVFIPDGKEAH